LLLNIPLLHGFQHFPQQFTSRLSFLCFTTSRLGFLCFASALYLQVVVVDFFQRNAAATFNFLLEEQRLVGAALIPPQTDSK